MASDEGTVYRFCTTTIPEVFDIVDKEKWEEGQIHDEFPETWGAFSYLFNTIMSDIFKSLKGNYSINIESQAGYKMKNGTYTGCYGSIRDNKSDFSLTFVDFPTDEYDKIEPYQIVLETPLKILSFYRVIKSVGTVNDFLLNSTKSFDDETWFSVFVLILCFIGLLITKRCLSGKRCRISLRRIIGHCVWETLLHFISCESTEYRKFIDRFLSIFMTLSFFLLTTIYFSLMSTDLVSVVKPSVIKSYQDIMNRPNMTLVFASSMSDTEEFEEADDPQLIEYKFWNKYKNRVELADPNGEGREKVLHILNKLGELDRVIIMNGFVLNGVRRMLCRLKFAFELPSLENVYTWFSKDPEAKMHQKGFILRKDMKQTRDVKLFRRKLRYAFDMGIIGQFYTQTMEEGLKSTRTFEFHDGLHSQVEKCISDELVYDQMASVDTVVLESFHILFTVALVMSIVSIITLAIEFFYKRYF